MLSIGIIGLPNVGKSTLFNALTDNNILAANYPFATIEPNTGTIPVPDERLQVLSELYKNAPIKPASVTFVDIAGLVSGASKGEGLGNLFLAHIRSVGAIIHVVRAFTDSNVQYVYDNHNPAKDIEIVNTELVLADLQTVTSRITRLDKEAKSNPKLIPYAAAAKEIEHLLDTGKPLFSLPDNVDDNKESVMRDFQLLTSKPIIYVFNVDEDQLTNTEYQKKLSALVAPSHSLFICAKLEDQLRELDEEDRVELLKSYGQTESGLSQLIKASYEVLGLQSFLTAGEKEVRAWTIHKGATAPQAAGVIHSDFERGFIAAEIVDYKDLISAGSISTARSTGKVRTEGKSYIMGPDDIVDFRFNT